ncbi:hypothetical protein [uncultured Methanomethylovorans sp.]|uniref:hypothetical protein n=1 Tax=uncultured Methanomethylovorans sp. TaxID=183759 RepID=UPI002AA7D2B9|nr:hypothetical protein [uncultured Methanomethylovorans sp.]
MGFSHYWTIIGELDRRKFKVYSEQVKQIVESTNVVLSGEDPFEMEPLVTEKIITINGFAYNSCEPFTIKPNHAGMFSCKTRKKHYDKVVVACLFLLREMFPEQIILGTDGNHNDLTAGLDLAATVGSITEKEFNNNLII